MEDWNIDGRKVLRIIKENGSNMVNAVNKLSEDSASNTPAVDEDEDED